MIDNETEQEAIRVIKSQNKKIKYLQSELERKEDELNILRNRVKQIDEYKLQVESFKRQVSVLDEKLRLYENEASSKQTQLVEQYRQVIVN